MTTKKRGRPKPWAKKKPAKPRELALELLVAIESRSAYSDRLLETRLRESSLPPEDARLVTALVQGTLRHRAALDHHLAHLAGERWDGLPPWIRNALRLGAFQLLFLDRIPAHAAVGESVELAKKYGHPGTAGLVNAILRKLAGGARAPMPDPESSPGSYLATKYSHPQWLVDRWLPRFGKDETERLLEANNQEPEISVRPNLARGTREEILRALKEDGVTPDPGPNGGPTWVLRGGGFVPSKSRAFRAGLISLQDEAEACVVPILDVRPGDRALDLCAAPGGKTAQLAEAVGPEGRVVAMERHPSRARALWNNVPGRLGLRNVLVVAADGMAPPLRGEFDRVLVDAPCSGLGVLRRRADARWRKEEESIRSMAALQPKLLDASASLVRKRGVLVYSVCSFEPEETVSVVESFLETHPEFVQEDARSYLPAAFRSEGPTLNAMPQRNGTDGVFAARFVRR